MGRNSNPIIKDIQIDLLRIAEDPKYGSFGVMKKGTVPFCCTIELPWKGNQRGVSRIPAGQYLVTKYKRPTGKMVYLLNNVPGRDMIEIHTANLSTELKGCIAVGNGFDHIKTAVDEGEGVSASAQAFFELIAMTENRDKWYLNISDRI